MKKLSWLYFRFYSRYKLRSLKLFNGYMDDNDIMASLKAIITNIGVYHWNFGSTEDRRKVAAECWQARKYIKDVENTEVSKLAYESTIKEMKKIYGDKYEDSVLQMNTLTNGNKTPYSIGVPLTAEVEEKIKKDDIRIYKAKNKEAEKIHKEALHRAFLYIADNMENWWD